MISNKERTPDDFINDEVILQLLHEAKTKSQDKELVSSIIAKANQYHGLSASEVAILLEVTDPDILESMYAVAADIKQKFMAHVLYYLHHFISPATVSTIVRIAATAAAIQAKYAVIYPWLK